MLDIAIFGASGRMGAALRTAMADRGELRLSAALVSPRSRSLGQSASAAEPGIHFTADIGQALSDAGALIEFSGPDALESLVEALEQQPVPLVSGTTGLAPAMEERLISLASRIPLVRAANYSTGIYWSEKIVGHLARNWDEAGDIEIVEAHHSGKIDAPSGTALSLGRAAARGRGAELSGAAVYAREGRCGPRKPGEIGFSVIRGGDLAGEHSVWFIAPGERIEITHRTFDRRAFAEGALRAAVWAAGQPPGLYDLGAVLAAPDLQGSCQDFPSGL